jgi:hypothetical protein
MPRWFLSAITLNARGEGASRKVSSLRLLSRRRAVTVCFNLGLLHFSLRMALEGFENGLPVALDLSQLLERRAWFCLPKEPALRFVRACACVNDQRTRIRGPANEGCSFEWVL